MPRMKPHKQMLRATWPGARSTVHRKGTRIGANFTECLRWLLVCEGWGPRGVVEEGWMREGGGGLGGGRGADGGDRFNGS